MEKRVTVKETKTRRRGKERKKGRDRGWRKKKTRK